MEKEERLKLYDEATETWGLLAQYDQCIEEMAELTIAISKYKRKKLYGEYECDSSIEENFIEELADVSMCIEQMRYMIGEDKVYDMLDKKLEKMKGQIIKTRVRKNGAVNN